jgi:hypothetical protein
MLDLVKWDDPDFLWAIAVIVSELRGREVSINIPMREKNDE